MTRIDFYLTQTSNERQRVVTACHLVEKVNKLRHHVFIYTDKEEQVQQLDELLWTFRDGRFLQQTTRDAANANRHSVVIGSRHQEDSAHDVMIILTGSVPDCFSRFERVAEIVGGIEDEKQAARQRFKFYRDRGYALETHELRNQTRT